MADDKSKRGTEDRIRINVNEAYELQYWSTQLGVSTQALRKSVDRVGPIGEGSEARSGKGVLDTRPRSRCMPPNLPAGSQMVT